MPKKTFDKIDAGNLVKAAHNTKKKTMEVHYAGGDSVIYENITAAAYKEFKKTFDAQNTLSPQTYLRAMVSRRRQPDLTVED